MPAGNAPTQQTKRSAARPNAPPKTASGEDSPSQEASASDGDTNQQAGSDSAKLEPPETCIPDGEQCFPEPKFVDRACSSRNPGLALTMFEKQAPWLRGYIRMREVDSVNTLGGPSSQTKLVFSEEVLVLRQRRASGGISGTGGYHVLRWDGTCATLAEDELVTWMPGLPQNPIINWKYLDDNIQEALLTNEQIRKARQEHRRECRGASVGSLGAACERAQKKLSDAIAQAVRTGVVALR